MQLCCAAQLEEHPSPTSGQAGRRGDDPAYQIKTVTASVERSPGLVPLDIGGQEMEFAGVGT